MSLFFYVGCQKEMDNHHSKAEKNKLVAQTVKRNYDLVKAYNKGKIIERSGMSYTLDEVLEQIAQLYSYAYGDFSVLSDSTYVFTDTVTITFSQTPIETTDFVNMTISIGNGYSVQTKPEDKLTFPNPIN